MSIANRKIQKVDAITITKPNMGVAVVDIVGTAPYVQKGFIMSVKEKMLLDQEAGSRAKSRKVRVSRDIEQEYRDAMHRATGGEYGIPAAAFRSAMISACRLVGFQMTKAKLSIFVIADGFDTDGGMPLVFLQGEPEMVTHNVRLESGVASIAVRPMWRDWGATLKLQFDNDQFNSQDVLNLLARAGMQVGVGEGRPDSRKSHGMGWGTAGQGKAGAAGMARHGEARLGAARHGSQGTARHGSQGTAWHGSQGTAWHGSQGTA